MLLCLPGRFTFTGGVRANYWSFNRELLVSPRQVLSVAGTGLLIGGVLILISRPIGVWLSLARALRSGRRGRRFKSSHPDHFLDSPPTGLLVGFFVSGVNLSSTRVLPESGESPLFSYEGVLQTLSR